MRAWTKESLYLTTPALILCCLLILSGCAAVAPASKDYYGIPTDGKAIVFVLDISGSMEGKDEGSLKDRATAAATDKAASTVGKTVGGKIGSFISGAMKKEATKLGKAKRELIPAVKGLAPGTHFTVVTFGSKIETWQPQLVQATDGNKTSAALFLERLSSNGGTPAKEALQRAFQLSNIETVFFLSDGHPNTSPDSILQEVSRLNPGRKVIVHAIGLGDDQDRDFLCKLAMENRGLYIRNDVVECQAQKP